MSKQNSKGVTLMNLMVTIIVMIMLTGVVAVSINGDRGILKKTSNSVVNYEIDDEREILDEAYATVYLESELNGEEITPEWLENELKENNKNTRVRVYQDDPSKYSVIFKKTSNEYSINIFTGEIEYLGVYTD